MSLTQKVTSYVSELVRKHREGVDFSRREFLGAATIVGGLAGLAVGLYRVFKPREARAQNHYRTVDEILAGTSFKDVCSEDYDGAVAKGNVVVFFYEKELKGRYDIENGQITTASSRLAEVFKAVLLQFEKDVTFLKYYHECDPNLTSNNYEGMKRKFGINGVPAFVMYKDGEKLYSLDKGPLKTNVEAWKLWMKEKLRNTFRI